MKLLLALCCVFLSVSASPLLGTEQCALGPVVWCENIQTASQCGALKHCQQTVWNKPTVKTVPCDLCKEVLTVVDNFLKDNCSESEVQDFLSKLCDLVPGISSNCKDLVTSYFRILYDMLLQELDNPGVICQALHLCQSLQPYLASLKSPQHLQTNEIPELDSSEMVQPFMANVPLLLFPQEKVQQESMTGDVCKDCLTLVTDLQDTLRSNTSYFTYLVNRALKECDALGGGLSDMCKTYVNQYSDYVLQALLQMPAQQLCSLIALCETKSPPQVLTPAEIVPAVKLQPAMKMDKEPSVELDPKCEVCELIVKQLERLLEGNKTQEAIEKALEKVCFLFPKKQRQKCIDFMDTYSGAIISLLEQEGSPKLVCCLLGVCPSKQRSNIVKLDPTVMKSGGFCQLCKLSMNYVDVLLEKNFTEERIKDALKRVCNFLPESMQDQCCAMVAQYEPLFIEYLLQALDPDFVCTKIGLCLSKLPLLGTDKCTRGPSYWCKDMDTAAMCNAIQHCKRHVWV